MECHACGTKESNIVTGYLTQMKLYLYFLVLLGNCKPDESDSPGNEFYISVTKVKTNIIWLRNEIQLLNIKASSG